MRRTGALDFAVSSRRQRRASRRHYRAPFVGIAAVLLGCVISTLDGRITRSASPTCEARCMPASTRAPGSPPLHGRANVIGPVSAWLGMVFGVRRVLMISASVFAISNLLLPFSPDLSLVLAFRRSAASLRHVHSADHRLRGAEPAAADGGLWRRRLFDEPRAVAQYRRFAGRLVLRQFLGTGSSGHARSWRRRCWSASISACRASR